MSHRTLVVGTIAVAWLLLAVFTWMSLSRPSGIEVHAKASEETVTVHAATEEQLARMELAVARFDALGLDLPPLDVHFPSSSGACASHKGRFTAGTTPWSISICSPEIQALYEHELAHAWVEANVDQRVRSDFMAMRGLSNWNHPEVAWNQRGTEWAAVIVQQGLSGLPLPPVLPDESQSRLKAFELLTGRVAPVLVEWVEAKDVPCSDRPTGLSRSIADRIGRTCRGQMAGDL